MLSKFDYILGNVTFTINYTGSAVSLPNYMDYLAFDFEDGNQLTRSLKWDATHAPLYWRDTETHTYSSYGTFNPAVTFFNNVSRLVLSQRIELEECVGGFQVHFESARYNKYAKSFKLIKIPLLFNFIILKFG
jgi:hypothetical protein